jgi:pimeloyl-ACP methyl ester carboxylesterase
MRITKKLVIDTIFLLLFCSISLSGQEEMYSPYPCVFIHGIGSSEELWDVARGLPDYKTGLGQYFGSIWPVYPGWDKDTKPYLEAFSFVPNDASIDYASQDDIGQDHKLAIQVKSILKKYYGDDWMDNPEAKVILVGHSSGGLASRSMLVEFPQLKPHIEKIVTIGTPHNGSRYYNPNACEPHNLALFYWLPIPNWKWFNWIVPGFADFVTSIIDRRFSPNGEDLNKDNTFLRNLNNSGNLPNQYGPHYVSIIGKHGISDSYIVTIWGIATAQAVYLSLHGRFVEAALKLGSAGYFDWWNKNSDGGVHVKSQNINKVGTGFNSEEIWINSFHSDVDVDKGPIHIHWHNGEARKWEFTRAAIEEPPVIHLDSVVTDKGTYVVSGTKDTVDGFILGLKGRVDDYLLASNKLRISCNYFAPRRLHWPNELGFNDNNFKVEDIQNQIYFGWNYIEITSENVLGEKAEPKT